MTEIPHRWAQIKELFGDLTDKSMATRARRLAEPGMTECRSEVGRLLVHYDAAGDDFLQSPWEDPPVEEAARFQPGDKIADGRFEIVKLLGSGGMGEVYEAYHSTVDEKVAIKVLSSRASAEPQAHVRLLREVQLARRITHPNVCRLHSVDVHNSGGQRILVVSMELLEGETLAAHLSKRGRLPLDETIWIFRQLLAGLAAAHAAGVIHRDLKPSNLMLSRDDAGALRLVILDFGLAQRRFPGPTAATQNFSGTPEYMAPEQWLGESRVESDIYALGLIAFEMLTGEKAFAGLVGENAVRRRLDDPPRRLRQLVSTLPASWERLVSICLEREPENRFRTVNQLLAAMDGTFPKKRARLPRSLGKLALASAAAVGVAAAGYLAATYGARLEGTGNLSLLPLTSDSGISMEPGVSPDGKSVAYVSDRDTHTNLELYIRDLARPDPKRLTFDPFEKNEPSFSPDGQTVVFHSAKAGGGLYRVSASGGAPTLLAPAGMTGRFSPDAKSVLFWIGEEAEVPSLPGGIYIVPANGGAPRHYADGFAQARYPIWFPDGRRILFQGMLSEKSRFEEASEWYVLDLASGKTSSTGIDQAFRASQLRIFGPSANINGNRIVMAARSETATNLFSFTLDPASNHLQGSFQPITTATNILFFPTVARTGALFCSNYSIATLENYRMRLSARHSPDLLSRTAKLDCHTTASADGRWMTFSRSNGLRDELWLQDLKTLQERRLLGLQATEYLPVIRPNGSSIAYVSGDGETRSIYLYDVSTAASRKLCTVCGDPAAWTPDGRALLVQTSARRIDSFAIDAVPATTGRLLLERSDGGVDEPQISPNGRWVAFRAPEPAGGSRVFVAPVSSSKPVRREDWTPITEERMTSGKPHWSPDGRAVFYSSDRDGFQCLWRQALSPKLEPVGVSQAVRHFHNHSLSLGLVSAASFNFSLVQDYVIFNAAHVSGNVWQGSVAQR